MLQSEEIKWLFNAMRSISLFQSFNITTIDSFIARIVKYSYPKGTDIVVEGDKGKAFYIIYKGRVEVWKKRKWGIFSKKTHIAELGPGEFFGEMSLVTNEPTTAYVTTLEQTELFLLLRSTFIELIYDNKELLEEIKFIIDKRRFEQKQK